MGKFFAKLIKILVWIGFTALLGLLYAAFFTGYMDALGDKDWPNILLMPLFVGAFVLVHYSVLWLINRIGIRDCSRGFGFFGMLREQGAGKGALICLAVLVLGYVAALPMILIHLYYTLIVFGLCKPKLNTYRYTPSAYSYRPTATAAPSHPSSETSTFGGTSSGVAPKPAPQPAPKPAPKPEPTYNFNSYKSYIQNNLSASGIRVSYGYTNFVRSARVTSLSLSFSSGSTPSVSASATVTLTIDNYAVRSYIGTDSHHNSTYANSNVVDGEISRALSNARDSAQREIESRITSLTRSFASQNGGAPRSVNARASVSARKG